LNDEPLAEQVIPENLGLETLDYVAIVVYFVLTFGIAVWFGRKQKDTEDFFVGGRRMPWFVIGLSILATLFSTLTYQGVPGDVIKNGIAIFTGYLSLPLTFLVITFLWIPFFMRFKLTSAYEYLELRFSYPVRALGATLFILLRLGWMSMVVFAASVALDHIKGPDLKFLYGPDLYWWIGTIGVVAAFYTAIGGIQAMAWVDVLQCLLLLFGVLMTIGFIMITDGTGPLDWWRTAKANTTSHVTPPLYSTDIFVRNTVLWVMINSFFWHCCTHASDQVVLQRYFSTPSLQAARRSYLTNLIVDVSMASLLTLAGLGLLAFYLKRTHLLPDGKSPIDMADRLFPTFLGNQLPAGCAGLVISAFLCDAIQTLEAGVNAITAVVSKDLMPKHSDKVEHSPAQLMFVRGLTVLIAFLAAAAAYGVNYVQSQNPELTLVGMMPKFFNMFVGPLAGMFIVGMFVPRATTRAILPAACVGLVVSIFWSWWEFIFQTKTGPTIFLAVAVPCVTTIVTAALLSLLLNRPGVHSGSGYTWWAIVRGRNEDGSPRRHVQE
jgi:SSS family solute:Na+ symporter